MVLATTICRRDNTVKVDKTQAKQGITKLKVSTRGAVLPYRNAVMLKYLVGRPVS